MTLKSKSFVGLLGLVALAGVVGAVPASAHEYGGDGGYDRGRGEHSYHQDYRPEWSPAHAHFEPRSEGYHREWQPEHRGYRAPEMRWHAERERW